MLEKDLESTSTPPQSGRVYVLEVRVASMARRSGPNCLRRGALLPGGVQKRSGRQAVEAAGIHFWRFKIRGFPVTCCGQRRRLICLSTVFRAYDYQRQAIEWILDHPRCGLFLDMGLARRSVR
ncbi:hypothetical protein RAH42_13080 (plasmid) [Pyramidobacter sp. YE332]|uniref:hypothetical protein n=1 Tax=Pyramidobacter sp. YE332 TaxID=3068894 RepID=UPI00294B40D2|nr:hypothetical protein [Pyramidobacter sp. YE332]WOL41345.1 hypothetical protein RAH42_13080 [Pyramidobacter sp. YE332]